MNKVTSYFKPNTVNKEKPVAEKEAGGSSGGIQSTCGISSSGDDVKLPYHPLSTFVFPKTACAEKYHSCQASWYAKFPWLHYDERYT